MFWGRKYGVGCDEGKADMGSQVKTRLCRGYSGARVVGTPALGSKVHLRKGRRYTCARVGGTHALGSEVHMR